MGHGQKKTGEDKPQGNGSASDSDVKNIALGVRVAKWMLRGDHSALERNLGREKGAGKRTGDTST